MIKTYRIKLSLILFKNVSINVQQTRHIKNLNKTLITFEELLMKTVRLFVLETLLCVTEDNYKRQIEKAYSTRNKYSLADARNFIFTYYSIGHSTSYRK